MKLDVSIYGSHNNHILGCYFQSLIVFNSKHFYVNTCNIAISSLSILLRAKYLWWAYLLIKLVFLVRKRCLDRDVYIVSWFFTSLAICALNVLAFSVLGIKILLEICFFFFFVNGFLLKCLFHSWSIAHFFKFPTAKKRLLWNMRGRWREVHKSAGKNCPCGIYEQIIYFT